MTSSAIASSVGAAQEPSDFRSAGFFAFEHPTRSMI
jgi:hypothetical protein